MNALPNLLPGASNLVPGLARTTLSGAARRQVSLRGARLGATLTNLAVPAQAMPVEAQPSMSLVRLPGGGVVTMLKRMSRHTENLSDGELESLKRLMGAAAREAEKLSRGPLSYAELRRRNHPFGRGTATPGGKRRGSIGRPSRPRGVAALGVTNIHSGRLAAGFVPQLERGKSGVTLSLVNETEYAGWLAFGTVKMQAHGAFTAAVVRMLPEINLEWLRLARLGWLRQQAMEAVNRSQD